VRYTVTHISPPAAALEVIVTVSWRSGALPTNITTIATFLILATITRPTPWVLVVIVIVGVGFLAP
jgi:hypothetical protein